MNTYTVLKKLVTWKCLFTSSNLQIQYNPYQNINDILQRPQKKNILEFTLNHKNTQNSQPNLSKKCWRQRTLGFKVYYKSSSISEENTAAIKTGTQNNGAKQIPETNPSLAKVSRPHNGENVISSNNGADNTGSIFAEE